MPNPTLKDIIAGHVETVFLNTDHFADVVTYTTPAGASRSVTGNWVLGEPRVNPANGLEVIHPATLQTVSSETFAREGIVTVNGEAWPVTEVGHVEFGMRKICCERRTKVRTSATNNKFGA